MLAEALSHLAFTPILKLHPFSPEWLGWPMSERYCGWA